MSPQTVDTHATLNLPIQSYTIAQSKCTGKTWNWRM